MHSHPLVRFSLPTDWEFWQRNDREHMRCCHQVVVLTLDGWRESQGVQAEMDLAIDMDLPIEPEDLHAALSLTGWILENIYPKALVQGY